MRIVFFGIYQIGVSALSKLLERDHSIIAVVTKPTDTSLQQPVIELALQHNLYVLRPESPRDPKFVTLIETLSPDLIVVAGYHKMIPPSILKIPQHGTINLHGSLLPKYRGPSTWKWAIINNEPVTGVTVHYMTSELDNGDILSSKVIPIQDSDTGGSLFSKISEVGAELLADTVDAIMSNSAQRYAQDEKSATYYSYLTEQHTQLNWHSGGQQIWRWVRASTPRPGAWSTINDQRLYITKVKVTNVPSTKLAGSVVNVGEEGLMVSTTTTDLLICEAGLTLDHITDAKLIAHKLGIGPNTRFSSPNADPLTDM